MWLLAQFFFSPAKPAEYLKFRFVTLTFFVQRTRMKFTWEIKHLLNKFLVLIEAGTEISFVLKRFKSR